MTQPLKVLVADDSPTARLLMTAMIEGAPDMRVVGQATNGTEAVTLARQQQPDVILMDIVMPGLDGLEATREIMHDTPTPIVLVSATLDTREADIAFQAINAGALTVQQKPAGVNHPSHKIEAARLLSTLRAMAGVHVIHHWKRHTTQSASPVPAAPAHLPRQLDQAAQGTHPELVAIVSSTGGPAALREILQALPADFGLPVVVVQHIAADFVPSLAQWLPHITPLAVTIAEQGGVPEPRRVYLAPGGVHLRLNRARRFVLGPEPSGGAHIPSGDVLFESVAASYGKQAIGVILTGMGSDGARGLLAMRQAGALTIAQDEATSVVYGMPREAAALGAVQQILPLPEIAGVLTYLADIEGKES
jgi:two-component system chemotaxis response regulator CheB